MPSLARPTSMRYGVAVFAVVLATATRSALDPALGNRFPFITYFVALIVSAWYGGLGPALLAMTLSSLAVPYFFLPPRGSFLIREIDSQVGFAIFAFVGMSIALLSGSMREAQRLAEENAREAEEGRRRLEREVAERLRAERDADARREWLRVTLESIGDAVIATDTLGRVEFLNPEARALTGWDGDEARGRPLADVFRIVNEETGDAVEDPASRALREGVVVGLANHTVLIARDGTKRAIDDSAAPIRDASGRVIGVVLVFRDVEERRRAERTLRESEQRFRDLADSIPQIVWVSRPDDSLKYLNARWFETTGMSPEASFSPGGWASVVHPDDLGRILEADGRSIASGTPFEAEYRLRDRSGAYRWHLGRSVSIADDSGKVLFRLGTATDIDDRNRGEQAARFLAEASASLATLVDEASTLRQVARLAVPYFADWCVVDMAEDDGTIRRLAVEHVDPAKIELALEIGRRYPPHPETPRGVARVIRSGEPELIPEISDAQLVAGARDEEHLAILREVGLTSFLSVPLRGRGKVLGAVSFVAAESGRRYGPGDLRLAEDLAQRAAIAVENARLYDELKEADRRKDEFLAVLAHELRNPLAPIRNALHLMKQPSGDGDGDGLEPERAMAERQVVHLARLVDDLMDVSRISRGKIELRKEPLDLASVVGRAVEAVRSALRELGHQLSVALPAEPIRLEADPTRLEQVLDNLLSNAVKYTEPGGRIALSAERDGDAAVLRVRDNGIGIEPEMLPRIFGLFVQVGHRPGRSEGGLGIGLSLVRNLVEMHGGTITAHSEGPGLGTEFVVRLPALPANSPPSDEPASDGRPRPGSQSPRARLRILVVDDNADAANSLARLLVRLHGQEVRVAHDGPSALEAAEAFRPEVALLDIGMPGMDGLEVARRLRARPGPASPLLVALTGWGQDADREESRAAGFDRHLVKPIDPETLGEILVEAGARASGSPQDCLPSGDGPEQVLDDG